MADKTLGFLGKGGVVQHFFKYLGSRTEQDSFMQEVKNLIFFQSGYETKTYYENSPAFKDIQRSIKENELRVSFEIVDNWKELISSCDMVIDASQSPIPYSLKEWGQSLWKDHFGVYNNGEKIILSPGEDFKKYLESEDGKKLSGDVGRLRKDFDTYEKEWHSSERYLDQIISVHNQFPLGCRSLNFLPFNIDMVIERAKAIKSAVSGTGISLPLYFNIVNEPCITSNIFASVYPEMAQRIIACTNNDLIRLEGKLNENLSGIKRKVGLEGYTVKFSLFGFHDDKVIVPEIWPMPDEDPVKFEKLFSQLKDYQQAYYHLIDELARYIDSSGQVDSPIQKERIDIRHDVDEGMMQVIVNGLKSIGKPLSIFPPFEKNPLFNGYFQPYYNQDEGFFMIGAHRFRNGKIITETSGVKL